MAIPELVIDETGIHIPPYSEILTYLQAGFRSIYGDDIYIENDSPDEQVIALYALGMSSCFNGAGASFNSFSPSKAVGAGLSSNVKINGMARAIPTHSTVDVTLIGQAGIPIQNGIVTDDAGTVDWLLPATVVIPSTGTITVTATAAVEGDIRAVPGSITKIKTQQFGWQSVNNVDSASPGAPKELDAPLRRRQARSTMLPARTVLDGIAGAILGLTGVTRVMPYENDTNTTDANGLPAHSISMVVTGGDATAIANTILMKKTPGGYTYGDVSVVLYTSSVPTTIRFFRPVVVELKVTITLDALPGYNSGIGAAVKQALVDYIASLTDGDDVLYTRLFVPANLGGSVDSQTYEITNLQLALFAGSFGAADIPVAFNARPSLLLANVTLVET